MCMRPAGQTRNLLSPENLHDTRMEDRRRGQNSWRRIASHLWVALGPNGLFAGITIDHCTAANPTTEPLLPCAPSNPTGASGEIAAGSCYSYCERSVAPRVSPLAPDGGGESPLGAL